MLEKVERVKISEVKDDVYGQRLELNDEELGDLAASIRRIGIIIPLVVVRQHGKFVVVAGHRRLRAASLCNLETVPVIVKDSKDAEITEVAIAENLFRTDLTPLEQACAIRDIVTGGVMDPPGVARAMHRSENWVRSQIALLDWPADVLEALHDKTISVSAASNLAMIEEETYRIFLLRNATEQGATARVTAAWLQAWRSSRPAAEAIQEEPLAPGASVTPMVPQAPCLACSDVYRTDELSHVPLCVHCIKAIRNAAR